LQAASFQSWPGALRLGVQLVCGKFRWDRREFGLGGGEVAGGAFDGFVDTGIAVFFALGVLGPRRVWATARSAAARAVAAAATLVRAAFRAGLATLAVLGAGKNAVTSPKPQ